MAKFTRENAREMLARSRESRRRNEQLRENPPPQQPLTMTAVNDPYILNRIARVRAIISRLDDRAMKATDDQAASWIATAAEKWTEMERKLSNRPAPGYTRPSADKPGRRRAAAAGPVDVQEPEPASEPTPQPVVTQ